LRKKVSAVRVSLWRRSWLSSGGAVSTKRLTSNETSSLIKKSMHYFSSPKVWYDKE
jgi:hypothetical protein